MRTLLFGGLLTIMAAAGCKKAGGDEDAYTRTFLFDVKNHEVVFGFKPVHNLTDSLYFEFSTINQYDCDKYRINTAEESSDKKLTFTLGNVYQEGGQCIYGSYPAIFRYKSPKLPTGNYRIIVKKNNVDFDGELKVTETGYFFDWVHDEHAMKITPKTFPR